jgi:hypothetical protein
LQEVAKADIGYVRWIAEKTAHFSGEPIKKSHYTEKQYQTCLDKLRSAKAANEEIDLFEEFNKK